MDPDTNAPIDELDEFARSFTADEPDPAPPTDPAPPAVDPPKEEIPKEETPKPEEKPKEEAPKTPEEDENPFETAKSEADKPKEEVKEPDKPTSSDDWSRLRESRNKHKAAAEEKEAILREKEAEIADLKQKAARTVELEEKLKAFDEQEKELALARVESTLEYKENIEKPLDAIGKQVEILVKSNEGDLTAVRAMLIEADPVKQRAMLKEITSGWDEIDRLDLKKMAEDTAVLLDKQDAMRSNAHAASKEQKEIAAKREAEQKEAARKEFQKVTGDVVQSLREKVPFVPLVEGETEDDRYSALAQKVAQVDLDVADARAKALAVASTFALPQAIRTIAAKDTEIASLKAALAKALSDKPSLDPTADKQTEEGERDFFEEFGIKDRSNMFGSMSLNPGGS